MRWFLIALLAGSVAASGCGRVENQAWRPSPPPATAVAEADREGLLPIQDAGDEPEFNTEAYDRIYENPFLLARDHPLSTFSIDVDTASYSNVRRFLENGRLPPPDAVRIEELINYFPYDYEPPGDETPFSAHAEVASCPWNPEHRLVRIGLKGKEIEEQERGEANLVFLLDVSGSMDRPNKLPLLKSALGMLVQNLSDRDRVAIVVYAGAAGVVLPPTSCEERPAILEAMDRLKAGGSTAGSAGIQLAYQVAQENFDAEGINRVILCTDGDFNVGITNQGDLIRLIEQKAAEGVFLTCLGFGMGNYKDSTLEKLANKGNGNYAYIDTIHEARKVLVEQLSGTLVTIAKDVKIQVDFNPARVGAYRLIGYENRMLRAEDFRDDTKDAGEIGAGHTVTALYELIPVGKEAHLPQAEPSKYQQTGQPTEAAASDELLTIRLRYKQPAAEISGEASFPVSDNGKSLDGAAGDFRFAAAVACFGMLLRNSEHQAESTYDLVLELARSGKGDDPHGYRREFVQLVELAKSIQGRRR